MLKEIIVANWKEDTRKCHDRREETSEEERKKRRQMNMQKTSGRKCISYSAVEVILFIDTLDALSKTSH